MSDIDEDYIMGKLINAFKKGGMEGQDAYLFARDAFAVLRPHLQPTPPAVTPDALSHVKMRLAQIASGDYQACGLTAEDCAKDALKAMTGVGKTAVTQEVVEKVRHNVNYALAGVRDVWSTEWDGGDEKAGIPDQAGTIRALEEVLELLPEVKS